MKTKYLSFPFCFSFYSEKLDFQSFSCLEDLLIQIFLEGFFYLNLYFALVYFLIICFKKLHRN